MSEELKIKQKQAARMLAGCDTNAITSRLGICAETLYRWRKLPEFKALIDQWIESSVQLQIAKLIDSSLTALQDSLSPETSDPVRLRAAMNVLKLAGLKHLPPPGPTESAAIAADLEELFEEPAAPPSQS